MKKIWSLILQYNSQVKYILIILVFFTMIVGIRSYITRISIEEAVIQKNYETMLEKERFYYTKNFELAYLSSNFADYFLTHENNSLFRDEIIVNFQTLEVKEITFDNSGYDNVFLLKDMSDAKSSWYTFIKDRLSKIK